VAEDYLASGTDLRRHPLALPQPQLEALGCGDTDQLTAQRAKRLPGLVLIPQRHGSASGTASLTIGDEHKVANLVVFEQIARRDRAALVSGRLLITEGQVEREIEHAEVAVTPRVLR